MTLSADIAAQRTVIDRETRTLRQLLMTAVVLRDGTLCHYCQGPTLLTYKGHPQRRTLDHVLPQSFGGTDDLDNLVLACQSCNSKKGNQVSQSQLCPTCRAGRGRLDLLPAAAGQERSQ